MNHAKNVVAPGPKPAPVEVPSDEHPTHRAYYEDLYGETLASFAEPEQPEPREPY